jgi:DNA-directed RNA polymerase beta' subunit
MESIERVSPDANVRYETAMRMRPQLEKLGVEVPFDDLTPEHFEKNRFNVFKESIAGFIQDPQQQLTAWERQRNQTLKDLKSDDELIRKYAETSTGLRAKAAQPKVAVVGGLQSVVDPNTNEVVPLTTAQQEAENKALIAGRTELSKQEAKTTAKQESTASGIEGFVNYYKSIPADLAAIQDAPESKISEIANQFVSNFIGNTKAAAATQKLRQIASLVLKGSPFMPGSQSDKELEQRKQELAAKIENANMSVEEKIEAVNTFVKATEMQIRSLKDQAAKGRSSLGVGADQPAQKTNEVKFLGFE